VRANCKNVLEDSGEVSLAAEYESDEELAVEVSQSLYWIQVVMIARGITLEQVSRHI
jgi:phosphoribosyl-ATP pyrophosphohydrolase